MQIVVKNEFANCLGSRRVVACVFVLAIVGIGLAGCMTTAQMAPPVGPGLAEFASARGMDSQTLERGRRVYLTQCNTCHSIEPIERYSLARWKLIAPEMAAESRLDDSESADMFAYLYYSRQFMDVIAAPVPSAD